ncbi:MAG: TIGR01440 family protein [Clostridia bacterium]|nr:TIGR01440 family protein [Clostridia bacterium]
MTLESIRAEARQAAEEVCHAAKLKEGDLFVVGCSSSEILGDRIGSHTSVEVAEAVFAGICEALSRHGVYLAVQCCEHLNRALIVEREAWQKFDLERVNVIPQPNHAGGALGTVAYQNMNDPVAVESLNQKALAGMDIGGTLIGMHLHPVVVPLRISRSTIGHATLICARYRPKYVGGPRAIYDEKLM